jgi:iron(III) transport system ATP-binding protein
MFIKIENLSFKYNNSKTNIVNNFNMEMEKGEILCILGESGSGKSTVLRIISGLEIPSNGRVIIDKHSIVDKNIFIQPEMRGIGMVFQDYALFPHMTVAENIKFGLKKFSKVEKQNRIEEMLELVNLQEFSTRYPYELSGGQQQRVAIARAVAPKPSLLLLDEPFSNLDAHLQGKIREDLKNILNKTGTTSIFVTHDKEDAKCIADKVIVLKQGEVIQSGATTSIFS